MSIEFLAPDVDELTPRITVIGVGGAGGNAIANMIRAEVQGVEFLVANTDAQALKQPRKPSSRCRSRSRARTCASSPPAWAAAPAPAPLP
jgi:cell division GTPase FtsZ